MKVARILAAALPLAAVAMLAAPATALQSSTIGLTAAPNVVTAGAGTLLTGTLSCGGAALPAQTVVIQHMIDGTFVSPTTLTTDELGRFGIKEFLPKPTIVRATYAGNGVCAATQTGWSLVAMRPGVALNATPSVALVGSTVSLTGSVAPSLAGGHVSLQMLDGAHGVWRTIATTALSSGSTYRFNYRNATTPGFLVFRTVVPAQAGWTANASRNVRVDWLSAATTTPPITTIVTTIPSTTTILCPTGNALLTAGFIPAGCPVPAFTS